jgi:hypothetical protein
MQLLNTFTKFRADRLYQPLDSLIRRDINDNSVETIIVGSALENRKVNIEYGLELTIANRFQTGELILIQDSSGVGLSHRYSFSEPEISEVEFSSGIVGVNIQLYIQCTGIGENPIFRYRYTTIPVT